MRWQVFCFLVFLASNTLLAYFPLSLPIKILIGAIGLLFPMVMALRLPGGRDAGEPVRGKDQFKIPWWAYGAVLIAAIFVRFYRLQSLLVWPLWDDAYNAFFGIQQMSDWRWDLTYTPETAPPLFYWGEGLFFRIFGPSLPAVWLFPALLSVLTLAAGFWAVRQYFPGKTASLFSLLLAFSFWPLYLGRFNVPAILVLPWEFLALGFLGRFWRFPSKRGLEIRALGLGLCVGAGFYTVILALVPILLITAAVFWLCWTHKPKAWRAFLFYLLPVLMLFVPLSAQYWGNIVQGHIHEHLMVLSGAPVDFVQQFRVSLSYLSSLLWGPEDLFGFCFGPFWGGLFNPILGSFLLLGLIEVWRLRGKAFFFSFYAVFLTLMLPGLASRTLEIMRIIPVLPGGLVLAALGWKSLISAFNPRRQMGMVAVFLLASASLDAYHLLGPYHRWSEPGPQSGPYKSPERFRAFEILQTRAGQAGPGLLLTELVPDVFDQSFFPATYPFNAAINPNLTPDQAHWTALFINARYGDYLKNRFPDCEIFPLSEGLPRPEGPLILVWIPQTPLSNPLLRRWLQAQQSLNAVLPLMPYHAGRGDFATVLKALQDRRPLFQGDAFLESCYWDKMAYIEELDNQTMEQARQSILQGINQCSSEPRLSLQCGHFWQKLANEEEYYFRDDVGALEALRHVIRQKYHLAQAYRQLADLLNRMGRTKEAEQASHRADAYGSQTAY